jgi:hypothetical protein
VKGNGEGSSWLHPNKVLMRGGAKHGPKRALPSIKMCSNYLFSFNFFSSDT